MESRGFLTFPINFEKFRLPLNHIANTLFASIVEYFKLHYFLKYELVGCYVIDSFIKIQSNKVNTKNIF